LHTFQDNTKAIGNNYLKYMKTKLHNSQNLKPLKCDTTNTMSLAACIAQLLVEQEARWEAACQWEEEEDWELEEQKAKGKEEWRVQEEQQHVEEEQKAQEEKEQKEREVKEHERW
jgi:hypothetical protein